MDDDPPPLFDFDDAAFDAEAFGEEALFTGADFLVPVALPERAAADDGLADAGAALERPGDDTPAVAGLELLAAADAGFAAGFAAAGSRFADVALFDAGALFDGTLFVEGLLVAALFDAGALLRLEVRLGAALFVEPALREVVPAGVAADFFFGELLLDEVFDEATEEDRAGEELLPERLDSEPAEERPLFRGAFSSSTMPTFSATDFTASLITCVTLPATSLTVSVTLSSARAIGEAADRDFLAAMILSSTFINSICRSHHHCLLFPHHPDERTTLHSF